MSNLNSWKSKSAAFMALGMTAVTLAPIVAPAPSFAQTNSFYDVSSNYWAAPFIQQLAQRGVIAGFPDGSFRPDAAVTRAEFAAMVRKAFNKAQERQPINFVDVSRNYWAYSAIQEAYSTGFLSGYPGQVFRPTQNIPREQVLVSLSNGLNYVTSGNVQSTLQYYNDGNNISDYARSPIAAATEKRLVVNYPNTKLLNPKSTATRADVAAYIYQALVSTNQASAINSPYIVAINTTAPVANVTIPEGTVLPVKYDKAEKILVTKDETAPLTLTISQNVVTDTGNLVIPAGSRVVGQLQPASGGSQFVAQKLILTTGKEYNINATSGIIDKTETIRKGTSVKGIVKNTALGAGAAAAVAAVTGDRAVATEEVLGGAAIGAITGIFFNKKSVDLIVIDPNTDLEMTIGRSFDVSLR
ncbi:MAG: S-layer homology domain-containing protein [Richelia sp. RM2_1_2]|nr:S-layer homology domain-containing protein [Richelia sp. SM2_1_7]NJM19313.1 S-layer homology domain-containing protein [Richelia sp. SM1_7_0]NJN09953.1 S-layer homology domain-containing protein [Richelia sp. RM1_1_1]NJO26419.1 S-layer homology domain-containing protein [Richelia sp. SL_2_1]NJO60897.1 S-layer homology domain-containing protein [Richelia sp. RM2_1_2]